MSDSIENFFICGKLQTDLRAFSLSGSLPVCCDFIALKTPEYRQEWYFTLPVSFNWSALDVLTDKLLELTVSVSSLLTEIVKRFAGQVRQKFDRCRNNFRRRLCRLKTPSTLALRL